MSIPASAVLAENVPRYTSYPTAPHFHAGIGAHHFVEWLTNARPGDGVSLYVHVPYCDKLCWFCACHTKHTRQYAPVAAFLTALKAEIALVARHLPATARIDAVHFGGGSPTLLTPADFVELMRTLRRHLPLHAATGVSVEIDPSDMDEAKMDGLAAAGMTRASLGVQDFDVKVQKAINRVQSFELTRHVAEGVRTRGARSVNIDLLYGLPHQTVASVTETVRLALELQPERIALFGYAHVPWFKKHQTMIDEDWLPDSQQRFAQSQTAGAALLTASYQAIGFDHFALPEDSLAKAASAGQLRRSFQGYTDDQCETLIGLGPSAISRFPEGYAQNTASTGAYSASVLSGSLPIERGIALNRDDAAAGWLIERLMCDFAFSADELLRRFGGSAFPLLRRATELIMSEPEKLVSENNHFIVPKAYHPLIRSVAVYFDRYASVGGRRHSPAV